jgi:uncharacterized membrane protein YfcA
MNLSQRDRELIAAAVVARLGQERRERVRRWLRWLVSFVSLVLAVVGVLHGYAVI